MNETLKNLLEKASTKSDSGHAFLSTLFDYAYNLSNSSEKELTKAIIQELSAVVWDNLGEKGDKLLLDNLREYHKNLFE